MSKDVLVRRLRPHLFTRYRRAQCLRPVCPFSSQPARPAEKESRSVTRDYEKRVEQLQAKSALTECYPRLPPASRLEHGTFERCHGGLNPGETAVGTKVRHAGRIRTVRTAGSKLCFVDIETGDSTTIQAVCQLGKLTETNPDISATAFETFRRLVRRGDSYLVEGHPHRTARGELSILATELPRLLSPSLHQIPTQLEDAEARAHNRHVDMLVNPAAIQTLRVRHHVEAALQAFFDERGFTKVSTPILSAGAGGANARPFETAATELPGEALNLRIAPELWLKRLVVGGLDKVYELGPVFRNEGVDFTHNPEFYTCEFYQAYTTLDDLMDMTQRILGTISERLQSTAANQPTVAEQPNRTITSAIQGPPFDRVEFIPSLEECLAHKLPDLESPDATRAVTDIFHRHSIPLPPQPSLSRLLDALAARFLEPLSAPSKPIFITHHPARMSPLSKHFRCPRTGQTVAARAELFIDGREYANMYEEENSPFEQRRKLELQRRQRATDAEAMDLDHAYLHALEWGLPPTGGWGCGLDRLVMLFAGRARMADVLAFGSLRNVVGLSKVGRR